jgi:hypothetical protein
VIVVTPELGRVSTHKYTELKPLVNVAALSDGMLIVADKTQLAVTDEKQSKVVALRDLSKAPDKDLVVDRTIHHVDTRGSKWGQHIAALVDTKPSPNAEGKPGVWFGKVDFATGKFLPTDYKDDMPGSTVSIPFVNGMWLVVGGGEMSVRGWGRGFPKRAVAEKVDDIVQGAAIPNRQFALINAKGELTLWKYSDDSITCTIGPTDQYGKLTTLATTEAGDLVVATADGKISLLHLAWPVPGTPILANAAVPAPLPKPSLQPIAQKNDLGSLIGMSIGKTP